MPSKKRKIKKSEKFFWYKVCYGCGIAIMAAGGVEQNFFYILPGLLFLIAGSLFQERS